MSTQCLSLLAAIIVLAGGCAQVPSYEEATDAYYGPQPTQDGAETAAKSVMSSYLKDPYSAQWTCQPTSKGYLRDGKAFGSLAYGWVLPCEINAKNSYGAYAGSKRYVFLLTDGIVRRVVEFGQSGVFATEQVIYGN